MLKKFLIIGIVCFLLILSACDSNQKIKSENLTSTDLSSVNIDGIIIGQAINDVDLSEYTVVAANSVEQKENAYYFEELRIETDTDGIITKVQGNIYGYMDNYNAIPFSVNGTDNLSSIDEVADLLGQNHNDYWFDKEQKIKAYTFYDDSGKFYATFAYDYNSNGLVWVILSK